MRTVRARVEVRTVRPEEPTDHTSAIDVTGALYRDRQPSAEGRLRDALLRLHPAGVAVFGLVTEQKRPRSEWTDHWTIIRPCRDWHRAQ